MSKSIPESLVIEPQAIPLLQGLKAILAPEATPTYLVGGFVRDCLLRRASRDIDLVVSGSSLDLAQKVARTLGGSYFILDEARQVARVVLGGKDSADQWYLDFSPLHGRLEEDLAQRDFTIDAMAVDIRDIDGRAAIIDPQGGRDDLERRVVRGVSEAAFLEDPLRLLRGARLAAELDFSIDDTTKAIIQRFHAYLAQASGERVRDELCRILLLPNAYTWLGLLDELELLGVVFPELMVGKGVIQPKEHYWDVFHHSLQTVAALEALLRGGEEEPLIYVSWIAELKDYFDQEVVRGRPRKIILKLAALLHDIAKPQARTFDEKGRMRFFGHGQQGAIIVRSILERLRFSTHEIKIAEVMVENHLRPGQLADTGLPTRRAIYRYFRDTNGIGLDILILSLADHWASRGPLLDLDEWRQHANTARYIMIKSLEEQEVVKPPKLVNGHDLMARFGLEPGPIIGQLLEAIQEAQAAGEVTTQEEALHLAEEKLSSLRQE